MSYPAINEVTTRTEAAAFLQDVLNYLGAHYGGTLAAHLVSLALVQVKTEPLTQELADLHEINRVNRAMLREGYIDIACCTADFGEHDDNCANKRPSDKQNP